VAAKRDSIPFRLSTNRVDFGIVRAGCVLRRTVTLTNQSGAGVAIELTGIPPWLEPKFADQAGTRAVIEFKVLPERLPGPGRQVCEVRVKAGNWHSQIMLSVVAPATRVHDQAGKQQTGGPRTGPPLDHGKSPSPRQDASKPVSEQAQTVLSGGLPALSPLVTGGVLFLMSGVAYEMTAEAVAVTPEAAFLPWVASGAVAMTLLAVALIADKVKEVVDRLGYDDRIRMNVTAGLQARVDSLRVGHKGQTFDCRKGVPFSAVLAKPTILELAHLGSDEEKAFLIGLLLMQLYETCETAGESRRIKHVTLVEEAHRLLTRTSTDTSAAESANVKGKSVEAFCNILAEVRAYGEGLVIAEQIPTKLADDVLKNTNLKVMHQLVAAADRALMGGTMNVDDEQSMVVTSLTRGEAVAFAEGVENPVLVQIPRFRGEGQVSDVHVRRASAAFYERHSDALGSFRGCRHCADVCHFGSRARRIAEDEGIRSAVWSYVLSCLRSASSATRGWDAFRKRLVPPAVLARLRPPDQEPLAWCIGQTAAERSFLELRSRGLSLWELDNLLRTFAEMSQAVRTKAEDTAIRVS